MTIRSSEFFKFAGESSELYGIMNVNIGSGMQEEPFLAPRSIKEIKIKGRKSPYFQEIEYEPLQFTVSFAFEDVWDDDKIRAVARWLGDQNYYQPLIFSSNENRWFYAVFIDSPTLIHNCLKQGYVELTVRCDSPYTYSPVVISSVFDYSINPIGGTSYTFVNNGDVNIKPLTEVEIINGGEFSIINNSNGGQKFNMTGLTDGENLTINFDTETIETDIPNTYRYDNVTSDSEHLEMVYGNNYLTIYGNIKIRWKHQSKLLQG